MIQFYAPDILTDAWLPQEEAGHCVRVLRKKVGDEIVVTNGEDKRFYCRIVESDSRNVRVEIEREEIVLPYWTPNIRLGIAPTKNADRMEWLIEKVVEMGINEICLLKCKNSERKVMKTERLQKIIVSAMKQSLKARVPQLAELQTIEEFLNKDDSESKYVAYCSDECGARKLLANTYNGNSSVTLLIGPEGDFAKDEIKLAFDKGFEAVSLGDSRLRTETAGLFGIAQIHTLIQQYSLNK